MSDPDTDARWTFGARAPARRPTRAGAAAAPGHRDWRSPSSADDPARRRAHRRPRATAESRAARRVVRRRRCRGVGDGAPTTSGGRTSTTPATSGRTTRASPSTRSPSTATAPTGTVTFPLAFEGPPGRRPRRLPRHVLRLRRSSTTTATSAWPARPPSLLRRVPAARRRSLRRSTFEIDRHGRRAAHHVARPAARATTTCCARRRWRPSPATAASLPARLAPAADADDRRRSSTPATACRSRSRRSCATRAAERGDHPLLICDDDVLTYADAATALGRAGQGPARRRRRPGHARRPAAPERVRLRRRLARRRPHRRGHDPAQHVLDQRRAARRCCAAPTSRCCWPRRRTAAATTSRRCARRCPELDLAAPPPLLDAVGARAAARRVRRPRRGVDAGWTVGALDAVPRRRRRARRGRGRGHAGRPHGDRAHVGLDQRAQGRHPPARPADPPPRQPQRAAALRRPTRCCSRTRRSSGSAASPTACSARCSPAPRWCARTPPTPPATLDLLERERPTMVNGFAAVGRAPRARTRRSPAATSSSIRRGNLWPIMPAGVRAGRPRAAPQHARHDRGRQRVPGQRRRGRPARAPARLVRPAGARVRGEGRRPRHRRRCATSARSASCGSAARS